MRTIQVVAGIAVSTMAWSPISAGINHQASPISSPQWSFLDRDEEGHLVCDIEAQIPGLAPGERLIVGPGMGFQSADFSVVGEATGEPTGPTKVVVKTGANEPEIIDGYWSEDRDKGERTIRFWPKPEQVADIFGGVTMVFAPAKGKAVVVDTAALSGMLDRINYCHRQRMIERGADPALVARLVTLPKGDLRALFDSNDYPDYSAKVGQEGSVTVLLTVGADGRVEDCRQVDGDKVRPLRDKACSRLRKRAVFEPGKDEAGNPIRAPFFQTIRWISPSH